MVNRSMVDSSTFLDIPLGHDIVAAYINGHFGVVTKAQMESRFPNAHYGHCFIDVNGTRSDAQVRDWRPATRAVRSSSGSGTTTSITAARTP